MAWRDCSTEHSCPRSNQSPFPFPFQIEGQRSGLFPASVESLSNVGQHQQRSSGHARDYYWDIVATWIGWLHAVATQGRRGRVPDRALSREWRTIRIVATFRFIVVHTTGSALHSPTCVASKSDTCENFGHLLHCGRCYIQKSISPIVDENQRDSRPRRWIVRCESCIECLCSVSTFVGVFVGV